jgi:hypothetical protein
MRVLTEIKRSLRFAKEQATAELMSLSLFQRRYLAGATQPSTSGFTPAESWHERFECLSSDVSTASLAAGRGATSRNVRMTVILERPVYRRPGSLPSTGELPGSHQTETLLRALLGTRRLSLDRLLSGAEHR